MTEPTRWPELPGYPGWHAFYQRLQQDMAALDPYAEVRVRLKCGRLYLYVDEVDPAVQTVARERCFTAEGESLRTCQVCGAAGQLHRDRGGWIRALCPEHAALDREELRALLRGER